MQAPKYLESFSRALRRSLSPAKKDLLTTKLETVEINPSNVQAITGCKKISIEIGFGNGEQIAQLALANPSQLYIGCEPYINGVVQLLYKIQKHALENVRIYPHDGRLLIESFAQDNLDEIRIPFPDPWPKSKHHKRRLIKPATLQLIQGKLKAQGELIIATDHADYGEWIKHYIAAFAQKFDIQILSSPPKHWAETKYERKAKAEGRPINYFIMKKMAD